MGIVIFNSVTVGVLCGILIIQIRSISIDDYELFFMFLLPPLRFLTTFLFHDSLESGEWQNSEVFSEGINQKIFSA
jgi:hypothetical protein